MGIGPANLVTERIQRNDYFLWRKEQKVVGCSGELALAFWRGVAIYDAAKALDECLV